MRRAGRAAVLDWLALLLVAIGALILDSGGFVTRVNGIRLSLRSPDRAWLAAVVVLSLRLLLDRQTGAFGVGWRESLRRVRALHLGDRARTLYVSDPVQVNERCAHGRWRRLGWATAGLLVMGAFLLQEQWRQPFSVPDLGDPLFSMWRMGWVTHQIFSDPRHLFDGNIFHPEPLTLTYSDSMILPSLTAAPFLALGLHPVLAYQVLFFSGFLLSGVAMYLLVERLTASTLSAFVAAAIFAYYPYRFEHYSHLELQMTQWMPLGLLALHRLLETGRRRYVWLLALAPVAQLYSSMYYAVFFVLYLLGVGGILLLFFRPRLRALLPSAVAAALVAAVLVAPLARAYVGSIQIRGDRHPEAVAEYSAALLDFFRAHERSATWGERMVPGRKPERALFPGAVPLALAAAGLVPPLSAARLAYAGGLLVTVDGARGFNGIVYPHLYEWFSPVRSMRVPARFSILLGMTLAVLAGFGVRRLLSYGGSPRVTAGMFVAVLAALAVDVWPHLDLRPVWREPPQVYDSLRGHDDVVLAEFPVPMATDRFADNLPYQYFSIWHWSPMTNGYSGNMPKSYRRFSDAVADFPSARAVAFLRSLGVTHVTYNCALTERDCARAVGQIEQSGAFRAVSQDVWEGEPVNLYELRR